MPQKWVIDEDYPAGRLVDMTPAEQAQHKADQKAGAAAAALLEKTNSNQAELVAAVTERMAALRKARSELAGGAIFSSLSAKERKVIDALLQGDMQFARLILELFDATDA